MGIFGVVLCVITKIQLYFELQHFVAGVEVVF
jgi:hypothetical protein